MSNTKTAAPKTQSRFATILSDVQFWVPVIVLIAGLLLLRFIH